jgi:hypothetical protein
LGKSAFLRFFAFKIFALNPVGNVWPFKSASSFGKGGARRTASACALYGHFCKIDRIGASSRRLLHVMGTYSFI